MADTTRSADLRIQLIDDVSKPARTVAEALAQADRRVREIAKDMNETSATSRLTQALAKLRTEKSDIDTVAKAWQDYAKSARLAANSGDWTKEQTAAVKVWERDTIQSVRAVVAERAREDALKREQLLKLDSEQQASLQRERSLELERERERERTRERDKALAAVLEKERERTSAREQAQERARNEAAERERERTLAREQAQERTRSEALAKEHERTLAREQAQERARSEALAKEHERTSAREQAQERAQLAALDRERHAAMEKRQRWYDGERNIVATLGAGALGGEMARGAGEAYSAGATVQERVAQLKTAGATDDEIAEARTRYGEFAKKHAGVLEQDYLSTFKDARVIAPGESQEMTELGGRYKAALRNSGLSSSEFDVGNVLRIMDELGLKNGGQREGFLDRILKSQQAFGGQISTETMLSAYRNAKQSIYGWSPEFRDKYFPTLLQSAGQQGGTEMMTGLNNYIGGHMSHAELKSLADNGFVRPQDLMYNKTGDIKGFKKGAQPFEAELFKSNFAQWSWDFHKSFMSRKGATESSFDDLIAKMPRAMAGAVAFMVHNEDRIKRDAETLDKPVGLKAADNASLAQNPVAGLTALKDSIEQFGAAVSSPFMKTAGEVLTSMAQGIQNAATSYAEWAKANPNAAPLAGATAVGVGAVGGTALLYGAAGSLFNGFGLSGSATALSASAAELSAAAAVMRGSAVVPPVLPTTKSSGLMGLLAGVAPLVAAKAYEDEIKTGLIGPALKFIFGEPGKILPVGVQPPTVGSVLRSAWGNLPPAYSFSENWGETGEWRTRAAYARQADDHPVIRGERDMEGARAEAMSHLDMHGKVDVDTSSLDQIAPKLEAAKAAMVPLSQPVALNIDLSVVDVATAKIRQLLGLMSALSNGASSIRVPSLGASLRGNFTSSGQLGE